MKQIISIFIFAILLLAVFVYAADKALVTSKPLIPLEAVGIRSGFELIANADSKKVTYSYYWLNSSGNRIYPYVTANGKQTFTARNWDSVPGIPNSMCAGASDPNPCCVGAAPNAGNTCDDTFDNADCTAGPVYVDGVKTTPGQPLDCCMGVGTGICSGWDDVVSYLVPLKNYLDDQVDQWENITRE